MTTTRKMLAYTAAVGIPIAAALAGKELVDYIRPQFGSLNYAEQIMIYTATMAESAYIGWIFGNIVKRKIYTQKPKPKLNLAKTKLNLAKTTFDIRETTGHMTSYYTTSEEQAKRIMK